MSTRENVTGQGLIAGGVLLALAGGGALGFYALSPAEASEPHGSVILSEPPPPAEGAGMELRAPVRAAGEKLLGEKVTLTFDGKTLAVPWKDLGAVLDEDAVTRVAARLEAKGGASAKVQPLPVTVDRVKVVEALVGLKDIYDRPATDARVDLISRKVMPEVNGFGIDVYRSIAALDDAARAGATEVALQGGPIEPAVTVAKLGNLDISHVMGWFETKYPPGEKDRNYNLRLVAEHVNGHILMPGELFSFNEIVGDRTEKQGYRVAHVISAGEMIDGLAGGACQISSTLHGAAWFAGLEMVDSRPHSRPSAYITMALDATVVYPTTDLKMKNPYDFPVVIHYVVAQGTVRVEILGRERPWDKVAFERQILEEKPFDTITREDPAMPLGSQIVDQVGFPGYKLIRKRLFYKNGAVAKSEKWDVAYPPTTEYVRIGTSPDPNLKPPVQPSTHGPMPPGGKSYHVEQ